MVCLEHLLRSSSSWCNQEEEEEEEKKRVIDVGGPQDERKRKRTDVCVCVFMSESERERRGELLTVSRTYCRGSGRAATRVTFYAPVLADERADHRAMNSLLNRTSRIKRKYIYMYVRTHSHTHTYIYK